MDQICSIWKTLFLTFKGRDFMPTRGTKQNITWTLLKRVVVNRTWKKFRPVRDLNFFQVLFTTTRFSSVLSCEDLLISSLHRSANIWIFIYLKSEYYVVHIFPLGHHEFALVGFTLFRRSLRSASSSFFSVLHLIWMKCHSTLQLSALFGVNGSFLSQRACRNFCMCVILPGPKNYPQCLSRLSRTLALFLTTFLQRENGIKST